MKPPLYSGPRCPSCGGDHFPAYHEAPDDLEELEAASAIVDRVAAETRLIADAVAESPVLYRFLTRIRMHARDHHSPDCEACFAWREYHDSLGPRARRPQSAAKREPGPDAYLDPIGRQRPPTTPTEAPSRVSALGTEYMTPAGLARWLRRNR